MNLELLKRQLERHEGRRLKPYVDTAGKITIGIGHNLTDNGLTDAQVDQIYADDSGEVVRVLPIVFSWYGAIDDVRQRALADVAFNVGLPGLLKFRHLLAACVAHDWPRAGRELLDSDAARGAPARYLALDRMITTGQDALPLDQKRGGM